MDQREWYDQTGTYSGVYCRKEVNAEMRLFGTDTMINENLKNGVYDQLKFATSLPNTRLVLSMPDAHLGYTFPIGTVAISKLAKDTVICPGGVGFDIGCGVRVITTNQTVDKLTNAQELANQLFRSCPNGLNSKGDGRFSDFIFQIVTGSMEHAYTGNSWEDDFRNSEGGGRRDISYGVKDFKDLEIPGPIVTVAQEQLGSLGSGNHFLEVDVVTDINDPHTASAYGLKMNQIVIQIHCGSRGFGHKLCNLNIEEIAAKQNITSNKETACATMYGPDGVRYWKHMTAASNYAFFNRQVLSRQVAIVMKEFFDCFESKTLYDLQHNIATIINGDLVIRKGATESLYEAPSTHAFLQGWAQPVFLPGSMGTNSYILAGRGKHLPNYIAEGYCCHGAGRSMGRNEAMRTETSSITAEKLKLRNIIVKTSDPKTLSQERPEAYKDASLIQDVACRCTDARRVATLSPLIVVKG